MSPRCRAFLTAVAVVWASPSAAAWVDQTYANFAKYLQQEIDEIAAVEKLSRLEQQAVEAMAGHWVFVGVCEGSRNDIDKEQSYLTLQRVNNPDMKSSVDRTMLAVISLITRQTIGRKGELPCRFALEKARSAPRR